MAARALQAKFSGQWTAAYTLGLYALAGGDTSAAESAWLQAVETAQQQSLFWEALGRMYDTLGRAEDALSAYQRAADISPGRPEIWQALAKIAYQQGQSKLATDSLENVRMALGVVNGGERYNFYLNLPSAKIQEPSTGYILPDLFYLFPQPLPTIFMHADSQAIYDLDLPDGKKNEIILFRSFIGMPPASWNQASDGVSFNLRIVAEGKEIELLQSTIDPKHNAQDRRWLPMEVNLTQWAGKPVTMILWTKTGPAGDNRYDWAGWGDPRIVVIPQEK